MANSLHDLWLAFLTRNANDDSFIVGGVNRYALNDNLLAAAGSSGIDTMALPGGVQAAHSFYIQVNASSGISAGQVILEGSNDNANWATVPYVDGGAASAAFFTGAAVTIAASTTRFFEGPVTFRYLRLRISTAFAGGTVSATARLSAAPYSSGAYAAVQATASNLKAAATPTPATSGGNSIYSGSIGNTATQIKSSAGQVYGWEINNPNGSLVYVQFFDTAVGSVTPGSTAPKYSIGVPANSSKSGQWPHGIAHGTAIVAAVTTTRAGGTAPGSTVDLNVLYT